MKKKWCTILFFYTAILTVTLSGCTVNNRSVLNDSQSQISNQSYDNTADSINQILIYLTDAMSRNQQTCEIFVSSESLINADQWLNSLPGIEQIHCEYRKIQNGYNVLVTLQYWDNYAIVYAHRNDDHSYLNERQKELYAKYIDVLDSYTSESNSDIQNEIAIHDYLVNNITYVVQDDSSFNAYNALIHEKAVCSGYTECFKTFMDLLGIENTTISGTAGDEQHIWNEVKLDNDWYQVDVTWDDPINNPLPCNDHSYFNITDNDMAIDHTWDKSQVGYHKATGTRYSYIGFMGMISVGSQSELNSFLQNAVGNEVSYLEFSSDTELDIKAALTTTNVSMTYNYKIVPRTGYYLYYLSFTYDS